MHNASSYGHLDIAQLLIKNNTVVNATDKWGFTPLHEAAQKGRTQLCALLVRIVLLNSFLLDFQFSNFLFQLAHGADPTLKNQEGQTPLDLCSADDVKCLLQDAMPTNVVIPTTNKSNTNSNPDMMLSARAALVGAAAVPAVVAAAVATAPDPVVMPSGSTAFPVVPVVGAGALAPGGAGVGFPMPHPGDGSMDFTKTEMVTPETSLNMSMGAFLASLGLEQLREVFDREHISVDILAEMGHEDLKQVRIPKIWS